jgi:RND superfamily putative drug exporter
MQRNFSTAGLARASARHPWRTIGGVLTLFAVAFLLISTLLSGALTTDATGTLTNNPESMQADNLLAERLGASNTFGEIVIVRSDTLTVDDPAYRAEVEQLYGDLTALDDAVVAGGTNYYLTGDESLVSADRKTTLIPLTIPEGVTTEIDQVHQVIDTANADGSFQVLVTGQATLDAEVKKVAQDDLAKGEGIGITVALIVLALVFGAIAAAFLPIVTAIVAIVIGLGATALLGQVMDIPFVVINVMTMLGLAVGIDYSLLVVSRYREERAKGLEKLDAIAVTGSTAGRTVVISGMTVALALAGLLIMPDSSNKAIGTGALLVILAAVVSSMTLLPAMLSLMGDKVNALRIPYIQRRSTGTSAESEHRFWDWITRIVMRRPVVSLVLAAGVLLAAAFPVLDLNQGEIGINGLPDGLMSKDAYIVLQQEFGFGQDLPATIVIDGQTDLDAVQTAITSLEATIAADPAFVGSALEVHPESNLSVLRVQLSGDATSGQAMEAVEQLRAEYIPQAFNGAPATALVTGKTAQLLDVKDVNDTYTPIVFAFVLGLSFVFLTLAFRSIVIPVKAILMNLLSVGAAYGLLVLVFQKGVGASFLGFKQVEVIQTGLPLFVFAILFGLSMDYHVFLLSRIRERFQETGDNDEAVAYGLRSTGRLITGAALIMVAVFSGFALGSMVPLQQLGFGLGVAVLVDATIVRSILVPASMRLLGKWNWYLPSFLRWLPQINLESAAPIEASAPAD